MIKKDTVIKEINRNLEDLHRQLQEVNKDLMETRRKIEASKSARGLK